MNDWPEVGRSSPAMQCIRVDFPEPDGPMTAVNQPRSKVTLTPSRAWTAACPVPYVLRSSTAWAAGADWRSLVDLPIELSDLSAISPRNVDRGLC